MLRNTREVWAKINGEDNGSFMLFEERGGMGEEDEDGVPDVDVDVGEGGQEEVKGGAEDLEGKGIEKGLLKEGEVQ